MKADGARRGVGAKEDLRIDLLAIGHAGRAGIRLGFGEVGDQSPCSSGVGLYGEPAATTASARPSTPSDELGAPVVVHIDGGKRRCRQVHTGSQCDLALEENEKPLTPVLRMRAHFTTMPRKEEDQL